MHIGPNIVASGGSHSSSTVTHSIQTTKVPSTQELFDSVGSRYENAYSSNPQHTRILDTLHSFLPENASTLDVGCGTGKPTAHHLASRGHDVRGIDLSPTMVSLSCENVPFSNASFEVADMTEYVPDKKLDAVTAFYALFQLPRREILAQLYRISSWLKPGGFLAMSTVPYGEFDGYCRLDALGVDPEKDENGAIFEWMGYECRQTTLTVDEWKSLLNKVGMEVVLLERFEFNPIDDGFGSLVKDRQLWIIAKKRPNLEPLLEDHLEMEPCSLNNEVHKHGMAEFADRMIWDRLDRAISVPDTLPLAIYGSGFNQLSEILSVAPRSSDSQVFADSNTTLASLFALPETQRNLIHIVSSNPALSDVTLVQPAPYNETINMLRDIAISRADLPSVPLQNHALQAAKQDLEAYGFSQADIRVTELNIDWSNLQLDDAMTQAASQLAGWMWPNINSQERLKVEKDIKCKLAIFWALPGFREGKLRFPVTVLKMQREHCK